MKHTVESSTVALVLAGLALAGTSSATYGASAVAAPSRFAASTTSITIDFSEDGVGSKPNGFTSADSTQVLFSSTTGSPAIGDFAEGDGRSLAAFDSGGNRGSMEIRTSTPTNSIRLAFGNDDPALAPAGSKAVLRLFRSGMLVATQSVVMNLDDEADQQIGQEKGPVFDRAVLTYTDAGEALLPLAEVVDNIRVGPLCTVWGNEGRNILTGTDGNDVICGAGGRDSIDARGGNDLVIAGSGNDTVDAGTGLDTVNAGAGNDNVLGRDGADTLLGTEGNDRLNGGPGTDRCNGGTGADTGTSCERRISL